MAAIPAGTLIPLDDVIQGSGIGELSGGNFNLTNAVDVLIVLFTGTILPGATLDVAVEQRSGGGAWNPVPGFTFPTRTIENCFQINLLRLHHTQAGKFIHAKTVVAGDNADHAVAFIEYTGDVPLLIHDTEFEITISRNAQAEDPPWAQIEGDPAPPKVARGKTGPIDLELRSLGARVHQQENSYAAKYVVKDDQYIVASGFIPLGVV